MKQGIHPQYFDDAKVTCACGAVYIAGSTVQAMVVESCSSCHPFYTGKLKLVDSARRVEKFEERKKKSASMKTKKQPKVEAAAEAPSAPVA